jgi:hypothetical protein
MRGIDRVLLINESFSKEVGKVTQNIESKMDAVGPRFENSRD